MKVLYRAPTGELGWLNEPMLTATTERHKIVLQPAGTQGDHDVLRTLDEDPAAGGLVIGLFTGRIGRDTLMLIGRVLSQEKRAWLYWPAEEAIECVDRDRLKSLWRHWAFITFNQQVLAPIGRIGESLRQWRQAVRQIPLAELPRRTASRVFRGKAARHHEGGVVLEPRAARIARLRRLANSVRPVSLPVPPVAGRRLTGTGVYLRTDYWARIESGGSYGHTCYVAKELAETTESFVCFMANRFKLLDELGVRQLVMDPPARSANEDDIVAASGYYAHLLKLPLELIRPSYIYERLVLGNFAGAALSQSLNIPYIVEYNGSEISMRRSFDGTGYLYEDEYIRAEDLAFKQATMISVISDEVKTGLVARGVPAAKILVNPNGADLDAYAPASADERAVIRRELGFNVDDPVIGFTGTFGGWHGVDVLAEAIPRICAAVPRSRLLLIGDGNYKHLVDQAIVAHRLTDRVRAVGRVPQQEGARLLKACDIYVSPHNSHMVDSKFFGSPTKIFEYMAMAGGIVASDLEQIGQILSPAFRPRDLASPDVHITNQRAVLCEPGNVDEFVTAVSALASRLDIARALGANARAAVADHYSWARHVENVWQFLNGHQPATSSASKVVTGDEYKDEVQRQWDNDPAGSHYVKDAPQHTLEWFLEAEAYRYGEYAPWMRETMEFDKHAGEEVLEIGGGMGTDLAQFAAGGAHVTDLDLSSGHLALAKESFQLRGLTGRFILHDAETLPFPDDSFDVVYSNGVLHHTPNTRDVVAEIRRVLKPGGKAIIMMYAENSLHYWRNLVWAIGLKEGQLQDFSIGEIMSCSVERSDHGGARPLVKVYTKTRLRNLFRQFDDISIVQRQLVAAEAPSLLTWFPLPQLGQLMGWNLIIKARKPRRSGVAAENSER